MKKILVLLFFISTLAFGQNYPSPTYKNLSVTTSMSAPLSAVSGLFNAICSSAVGQVWVRASGGFGCTALGYANPIWWGADPTGATDSTSAEQSAIAAECAAGGGAVFYPAGIYKTSGITLNCSNVRLYGIGKNISVIAGSTAAGTTLLIGSPTSTLESVYVTSLSFIPSVTKTGGSEVHIEGNNINVYVNDVLFSGGYNQIIEDSYGSASLYYVTNCYFGNSVNTSVVVGTANGLMQGAIFQNLDFGADTGAFLFENVSGFYLNTIDIILSSVNAITLAPASGQEVVFGFLDTVQADTTTGIGWVFQPTGTGILGGIVCNKCWAAGSTGAAGMLINGANVNGITLATSMIRDNAETGISIEAGTNITIEGSQIFNNSTSASATFHGVAVAGGVTGLTFTDNISGLGGLDALKGAPNLQGYGLLLATSSATNNLVITGNRFPGNVTGGIANGASGANQVVTNNLNF